MRGERLRLALVLAVAAISVTLFATVTPYGRGPDEFRYYADIAKTARTGRVANSTGHPPLYTVAARLPYALGSSITGRAYLIRLGGVVLAVGIVLLAYLTAAELFGEGSLGRWLPPLIVALLPQFAFVSAMINSDALLALLTAALIYLCVRLMRRGATPSVLIELAGVIVLGGFAKQRFLVLLPLPVVCLAVAAHRRLRGSLSIRASRNLLRVGAIVGGLLGFGLPVIVFMLPRLSTGMVAGVIHRDYFIDLFATFWGYFDDPALPMHVATYLIFAALCALAVVGAVLASGRRLKRLGFVEAMTDSRGGTWLVLAGAIVLAILSVIAYRVTGLASPGRYLFIALVPIALFMGRGLAELVPPRLARLAFQTLTLLLVGIMFAQVVLVVIPYYY